MPPEQLPSANLLWPGSVSKDGKWLAYGSDEGGSGQVYIRPFPGPGRAERMTRDGGSMATWAPDGRAVFYWVGEPTRIMRVPVDTSGDRVKVGRAEVFAADAQASLRLSARGPL